MAALLLALGREAEVARLDGRLADVLHHSTFVVSAWDGAILVGAARVISDGIALALVQHLGVRPAYQGRSIGGDLLRRCLTRYGHTMLVALVDDPADAGFYAHFGFRTTKLAMVKDAAYYGVRCSGCAMTSSPRAVPFGRYRTSRICDISLSLSKLAHSSSTRARQSSASYADDCRARVIMAMYIVRTRQ